MPRARQTPVVVPLPGRRRREPASASPTSAASSTATAGAPGPGANPTDQPQTAHGIVLPARSLAMHPGPEQDVAVGWRSPIQGLVRVQASLAHAQSGGNGIEWWIAHENSAERKTLAHGVTDGTSKTPISAQAKDLDQVAVEPGELLSLVVGPKGAHQCDTTIIEFVISEMGERGQVWNLKQDVVGTLHAGNPHADGQGRTNVWHFIARRLLRPRSFHPSPRSNWLRRHPLPGSSFRNSSAATCAPSASRFVPTRSRPGKGPLPRCAGPTCRRTRRRRAVRSR